MNDQSAAVVGFISNLMPLYDGEHHEHTWCARSLEDGTLILPVLDPDDEDPENAFVRVRWQGAQERESVVSGGYLATLAVVRYVQLHQAGQPAKRVTAELEHLAQHFSYKTGCSLYLPYERPGADLSSAVRRAVGRLGEGAVVNMLTKAVGF